MFQFCEAAQSAEKVKSRSTSISFFNVAHTTCTSFEQEALLIPPSTLKLQPSFKKIDDLIRVKEW